MTELATMSARGSADAVSRREPVAVLVVRKVRRGHEDALETKVNALLRRASSVRGYLDSTVLRGHEGVEPRLYVLLKFEDFEAWRAWESSKDCQTLLQDALRHVVASPTVTLGEGFAGWFDLPGNPMPAVPVKWKMAVVTWLAIFPILSLFLTGTAPLMGGLHPIGRLFLNTLIIVPLMTWFVMPGMTKLFRRWLFPAASGPDMGGASR